MWYVKIKVEKSRTILKGTNNSNVCFEYVLPRISDPLRCKSKFVPALNVHLSMEGGKFIIVLRYMQVLVILLLSTRMGCNLHV